MNKVGVIFRHELYTAIHRVGFWLGVFSPLAVGLVILLGMKVIGQPAQSDGTASPLASVQAILNEKDDARPRGLVDPGGLLKLTPPVFPTQHWLYFPDKASAQAELDAGSIEAYYVIPADYVAVGDIQMFRQKFRLAVSDIRTQELKWLISYNLLHGDEAFVQWVDNPIQTLNKTSLAPAGTKPKGDIGDTPSVISLYLLALLLLTSIMGSSSIMLASMAKERENRALEIILLSATPRQILFGKVFGLGLLGLITTLGWGVDALILQNVGGPGPVGMAMTAIRPDVVLWAILFFLLGYLIYATLMTGIGTLVPHLREVSQIASFVMMPLMAPFLMFTVFLEKPNNIVPVLLSLFPLTAPVAMVMRISATTVPNWQIALSILLCAAAAWIIVSITAKLFRSQTLLSNQKAKTNGIFAKLFGH